MPVKLRPTFKKLIGRDIADLYVGPEKEHFYVYRAAICSKIPYFEKMFKDGGFVESYHKSATFPEDDPETFDLLPGWVYHGSIKVSAAIADKRGELKLPWKQNSLYKLAERSVFRNCKTKSLIRLASLIARLSACRQQT